MKWERRRIYDPGVIVLWLLEPFLDQHDFGWVMPRNDEEAFDCLHVRIRAWLIALFVSAGLAVFGNVLANDVGLGFAHFVVGLIFGSCFILMGFSSTLLLISVGRWVCIQAFAWLVPRMKPGRRVTFFLKWLCIPSVFEFVYGALGAWVFHDTLMNL